jgi:hypothetical protein
MPFFSVGASGAIFVKCETQFFLALASICVDFISGLYLFLRIAFISTLISTIVGNNSLQSNNCFFKDAWRLKTNPVPAQYEG